ncbi:hypothetical protein LINPERHAP1_LOCUS23048 [Linum perenne]
MNRADRRTTAAAPELSHPSGEEARLVDDGDDYSSGASTPPLWRAASPPPHTSSLSSGGDLTHYRSLSPAARTQAIARGQRELMEMVSRMPEGCYELSLKDLVEHQYQIGIENPPPATADKKLNDGGGGGGGGKVRWAVSNNPVAGAKISRSGSLDNGGFLLKMGLPVSSLRSRNGSKKKTNPYAGGKAGSQKDGRISPTGKSGGCGMAEKEWWKDESESFAGFSSYSDSRSSKSSSHGSSSRSSSINSSNNNNNRRRSGGCCLFFWSTKVKVAD